jgi:hypothetical protein
MGLSALICKRLCPLRNTASAAKRIVAQSVPGVFARRVQRTNSYTEIDAVAPHRAVIDAASRRRSHGRQIHQTFQACSSNA